MSLLNKMKWGLLALTFAVCTTAEAAEFSDPSVRARMYAAASEGNKPELLRLVGLGYSLEMMDANGNTPYCEAVWSQNRKAVATLIEAGCDVRPRCLKKIPYVTASRIYAAAHAEDLDQLIAWKKEGLNVDVVDSGTGDSALCEAVYNYDCPAIQTLLRAGSKQAQPCMRRIPAEVREHLECRPIKIDWNVIGYTVLGTGMVGAMIAILGSHGGNGTPVCNPDERWDGKQCLSCATCWVGMTCLTQEEMDDTPHGNKHPKYRDETTGECWVVSPPPVGFPIMDNGGGAAYEQAKKKFTNDGKYADSLILPTIHAAGAYARGYSGLMVERTTPNGRLYNDAVEPGATPILSNNKVIVAIASTGMDIGKQGTVGVEDESGDNNNTTGNNLVANQLTEMKKTSADGWDWSTVNKAFYNHYQTASTGTTTNNKTVTFTPTTGSNTTTSTNVGLLGKVDTNILTNSAGKPVGFNYDESYGACPANADGNTSGWNRCYGPAKFSYEEEEQIISSDTEFAAYYLNGKVSHVVLVNARSNNVVGVTTNPKDCLVDVSVDEERGYGCGTYQSIYDNILQYYTYKTGYKYDEYDPSPHYSSTSSSFDIGDFGTWYAGIIAAMRYYVDGSYTGKKTTILAGDMYGVAYNAAILPIIRDTVLGINTGVSSVAYLNGAKILLSDSTIEASIPEVDDLLGGFIYTDKRFTSMDPDKVFGSAYFGYEKAVDNGMVVVIGNGDQQGASKFTQPSLESGMALLSNYAIGGAISWGDTNAEWTAAGAWTVSPQSPFYERFLTVGSIKSVAENGEYLNAELADYSQPCGLAASYCVVAPGGVSRTSSQGIESTVNPGTGGGFTYGYNATTNASAAVVAGALAVIMGAYPHLTGQQAVEILLRTADYITPTQLQIDTYNSWAATTGDDNSTTGTKRYFEGSSVVGKSQLPHSYNAIFGYGLINLEAATDPLYGKEGLWVYKNGTHIGGSDVVYTTANTSLTSTASITPTLAKNLPTGFVAFDDYNRAFVLPTSMLFRQQYRRKTKSWNDFKLFMSGRDPIVVADRDDFSMQYRERLGHVSNKTMQAGLMEMKLKHDKMSYGLFFTEDTSAGRGAYWKRRMNNPFIQMHEAYGLETGYELNSKWQAQFGWIGGRNGFFDEDDNDFNAPDNKMQAFTSSVVYKPVDQLAFQVATGVMRETGSSLGIISSGGFEIEGARTYFMGAGVTLSPMDKLRLEAMYYYGKTHTSQGGGLMNLSRMTSDSFAVTASYQPDEETLFGLQVSSPLRVRKGTLDVTLPVGRDMTEDVYYYETYSADMKPKAREFDLSLYYQGKMADNVKLQSELGVRLHPDHQADAEPDYRGMVGVKWNY